jgi:hypothetical protein
MTRRVKVACATITPSGSDEWKGHGAAPGTAVKAGKTGLTPLKPSGIRRHSQETLKVPIGHFVYVFVT